MEEDSGCSSVSLPNLLCRESQEEACFFKELEDDEDDSFTRLSNLFVTENEDEYIQMLIQRENGTIIPIPATTKSTNWLKCARLDAIQWILRIRGLFGFCFQTAYLSITYFDQFLSKRCIDNEKIWAIRLLSVACLTLAAKMEECNVPALSEFRLEEYNFDNKVIQRMELLVLNTLEWRMASITPFAYLHYFISKFNYESALNDIVSRTVEHVLAIVTEMNLMDQRPSTIAAAAVLVASNKGLTRKMVDLKMNSISSCGFLQNDEVFSCYNLMLELDTKNIKTPKFVIAPDLSSIYSSSTDANEDSFYASVSRTKRRRLTFHDFDQNCDMPSEKGLERRSQ